MNIQDHISQLSAKYEVPSQLSMALARVSSDMNNFSWDFDPTHQWLWDMENNKPFRKLSDSEVFSTLAPEGFAVPKNFPRSDDAEFMAQRCTWGGFKMHGSFFRQAGYLGLFHDLLNDPQLVVHFALVRLQQLHAQYYKKHGWAGVAAAFHPGRPRMNDEGMYVNREYLAGLLLAVPNLRNVMSFQ